MIDPNLRNIAMKGLREAVGVYQTHTVRSLTNDWRQKGAITDADVAEIEGMLNGMSGPSMKQQIIDMVGHYGSFDIARRTMEAVSQELLTTADAEEIYAAMSAASGAGST